jgi:SsrA-binding protein
MLFLHKKEIRQLLGKLTLKHAACVPMSVYWKDNKIKCKIAVATGKNQHDKRQTIKNREWERNKQRILKQETR